MLWIIFAPVLLLISFLGFMFLWAISPIWAILAVVGLVFCIYCIETA